MPSAPDVVFNTQQWNLPPPAAPFKRFVRVIVSVLSRHETRAGFLIRGGLSNRIGEENVTVTLSSPTFSSLGNIGQLLPCQRASEAPGQSGMTRHPPLVGLHGSHDVEMVVVHPPDRYLSRWPASSRYDAVCQKDGNVAGVFAFFGIELRLVDVKAVASPTGSVTFGAIDDYAAVRTALEPDLLRAREIIAGDSAIPEQLW